MRKVKVIKDKNDQRERRKARFKSAGTEKRPRLTIFRSNKYIYAQLVDDSKGKTLTGVGEKDLKINEKISKIEKAKMVGQKIAEVALNKKIKEIVFDRSGYKYHGRVKALAEGAREKGLKF